MSKISQIFTNNKYFSLWGIQNWKINIYGWLWFLFYFIFWKWAQILTFDTKSSQIARMSMAIFIDLWPCLFTTKLSYTQLFLWGHSTIGPSMNRLHQQIQILNTWPDNYLSLVVYCSWVEFTLHRGFLEHWNSQKSASNIWQRFSYLLDEGIPKIWKKLNFHGGFLRAD